MDEKEEAEQLKVVDEQIQAGHLQLNPTGMLVMPAVVEARVIGYLARGDAQETIVENILKDFGYKLDRPSIIRIRKRNEETFKLIKDELTKFELETAMNLVIKSRKLINKRLDDSFLSRQIVKKASEDFMHGKIEVKDYLAVIKANPQVSVNELVAVSKEMFNENEHEQGRGTPDALAMGSRAKQIQAVADAIKSGNVKVLERIVFTDAQQPPITTISADVDKDGQ